MPRHSPESGSTENTAILRRTVRSGRKRITPDDFSVTEREWFAKGKVPETDQPAPASEIKPAPETPPPTAAGGATVRHLTREEKAAQTKEVEAAAIKKVWRAIDHHVGAEDVKPAEAAERQARAAQVREEQEDYHEKLAAKRQEKRGVAEAAEPKTSKRTLEAPRQEEIIPRELVNRLHALEFNLGDSASYIQGLEAVKNLLLPSRGWGGNERALALIRSTGRAKLNDAKGHIQAKEKPGFFKRIFGKKDPWLEASIQPQLERYERVFKK